MADLLSHLPSGIIALPDTLLTLSASSTSLTSAAPLEPAHAVGHGHPPHSPPKLSAVQQAEALAAVHAGQSYRKVARQYGVSYQTIYRLARHNLRGDAQ
jgi:hypothetical protein